MDKFNEYIQLFDSKNCRLLTTFEQFKELTKTKDPSFTKVEFIATCGHTNSVIITNFKSKNSGVVCKQCMVNTVKLRLVTCSRH